MLAKNILFLITPFMAFNRPASASWDSTSNSGAVKICGTSCACLFQPVSDSKINDICSRIMSNPCQDIIIPGAVGGSLVWAYDKTRQCSSGWAPVDQSQCRMRWIEIEAAKNESPNGCVGIGDVNGDDGKRVGVISTVGGCMPIRPGGIC